MVLLLRKLYVYFTKDPEGVHYFQGGGVRTPYPPLDPHMDNVIITGQYLSQSRF